MVVPDESGLDAAASRQVVAVLGRPDPDAVRRLRAATPGLASLVDLPHAQIWAGPGLTAWQSGQAHGWTWASPAREVAPTSWTSASRDALAPGVAVGPDGVAVHTDGIALQDVYARMLGAAVYLSTRLLPLLDLDDSPLTPDLEAWAGMLTVGAPVGGATPVTQVRRLTAGAAWTVTPDGAILEQSAPAPWDDLPARQVKPEEMTELLTAAVPAGPEPLVVALSGGWDSRVLASLATRRGHPLEAWTTYQYHPREKDVVWAGRVAESLGIPQRLVLPQGRDWAVQQAAARRRMEFQTSRHMWLFALSEELRAQPLPVLDGAYGDALLRGDLAYKGAASNPDWVLGIFDNTGGKRLQFVAPSLAPLLGEVVVGGYRRIAETVADHPNAATLTQLLTRQNRAVTLAARRLFGPETDVWMPFTHPDVLRGALSVPLADKQDNAYYLQVLTTACGPEGQLRSSNHPGAGRQKRADAFLPASLIEALMSTVRHSERATALLGPVLRDALVADDGAESLRRRLRPVEVLGWAALLADFEQEYAGRLDWSGWPV